MGLPRDRAQKFIMAEERGATIPVGRLHFKSVPVERFSRRRGRSSIKQKGLSLHDKKKKKANIYYALP